MNTLFLTRPMRLAFACLCLLIQGLVAPQLPQAQQSADSSRLDKLQAGFYRMKIGAIDVVALSDGTITFDVLEVLSRPKEAASVMAKAGIKSPVEASMNVFWISLGQRQILVDTGAGELMGPKLNKLTLSMNAAGISPEQITDILITHIHPDHSGGLSVGGRRVFPNAVVHVDKRELSFWTDKSVGEKLPEPSKTFFKQVEQTVGPYIAANKVQTFDGATQLFPEIRAIPGYGHTPGQAYFVLESMGQKLVFLGDTLHAPDVQFEVPSITVKFDVDQKAAAATRKRTFDDAAKNGYLIAFAHMYFPGTGRVRKEGNRYRWYPMPYTNDATKY
jgi:glyoxylase-like metal-dependent hydrolase (beta-lactamase superfamily II)